MGILPDVELTADPERTGNIESSPASLFWDHGYRHMFQHGRGWVRLELLRLAPDSGFFNLSGGFLPGGIATHVVSSSGWNTKKSKFHEYLRQGVTITAGAARAGGGAPHIHNRSFWDEDIFYAFLTKGRTIGEVLLMNQIHLGWVTTFVGDPLLGFPRKPTKPDEFPGLTWDGDIDVRPTRFLEFGNGFLVIADMGSTPQTPRVAQMRMFPAGTGYNPDTAFIFERFSSRPHVFIPSSRAEKGALWTLELIDPFGNTARVQGRLE
jgi:hypothetical protein